MAEQLIAPFRRSAVALVEEAGSRGGFVMQQRPDLPGVVHPGAWRFLGGGAKVGEDPLTTIFRELDDEVAGVTGGDFWLRHMETATRLVQETPEHALGATAVREISLFWLNVPPHSLSLKESGELITIPKTLGAVEANKERMTPYTYRRLLMRIKGEGPWKGKLV